MKGQTGIEYIVAMIIFVLFVIYITFQVANIIPYYHSNSLKNRIYSECYRISEAMLKDSKLEYGFSKEPYDLNSTKMEDFNQTCATNYNDVIGYMGLKPERDIQLIVSVNSSFGFTCGRRIIPSNLIVSTIERYAVTDGQPTNIKLSVW